MNRDIKAINEQYNKEGINNTVRNADSYMYPATDYAIQRSEQEEHGNLKRVVMIDLNNTYKRAQRGLSEDYKFILIMLDKIKKDIAGLL